MSIHESLSLYAPWHDYCNKILNLFFSAIINPYFPLQDVLLLSSSSLQSWYFFNDILLRTYVVWNNDR